MAVVLGIFAGTGMDVRAADEYEIVEIDKLDNYDRLKDSCEFKDSDGNSNARKEYIESRSDLLIALSGNDKPIVVYETYEAGGVCIRCLSPADNNNGWGKITFYNDKGYNYYKNQEYHWFLLKKKVASPSSASDSEASSPSSASDSEASSPTPHTHSYSWVTVQEVSSEQDGIEEYRCSCGDVQERCVVPRYMAIVKGLFGEIKNAPQNGTATFDSGRLYTISDYVIKKLAERTDVTTVITFEYQNQAYKMTIPAGADFTGLLADEEYFYGYFFFANAVGATIEAIAG